MDKNAIKKYAVWARTELIERVRQRALKYEVAADADANADSASGKVLTDIEKTQRAAGIARMREKGYEYVIEEVAYTWFNRFAALRYMEVNNYLPTRVRVFTDENGAFKPQILAEAIHLNLDGLDMEKVYALKEAENNDELYKYLLITQCNALSAVLPQMFKPVDERCKEEKNDYTILLFPDNQLREGSVIEQMVSLIPEDNWQDAVQIIGWLYQYYNIEQNDLVYDGSMSKSRLPKELIPAATTIFTPDWSVRYMVENSLGRLWLEGHPQNTEELLPTEEEQARYIAGDRSSEDFKWYYYLRDAQQEPEVEAQLAEIRKEYAALKPEDILCIDPCMGSGHILAYLFDTLIKIYAVYGYSTRESVQSIVEHNLYGLDINDRAAQLAYFEVMMTAVKYDSRFLKRTDNDGKPAVPQPHVYAIQESNHIRYEKEFGDFLLSEEHRDTLRYLLDVFQDAKEYGSILQVEKKDYAGFLEAWKSCAEASLENIMMMSWYMQANECVQALARQAIVLSQKYEVIATNPPYLSNTRFGDSLDKYVKENYVDEKSDLSMVMLKKAMCDFSRINGFIAFITTTSWMFLSSFEKTRSYMLRNLCVDSVVDFGTELFDGKVGHNPIVAWVNRNNRLNKRMKALRLVEYCYSRRNEKERAFFDQKNHYVAEQAKFVQIPGTPIAYWVSNNFIEAFKNPTIGELAKPRQGLATGCNDMFIREWYEVKYNKIKFDAKSIEESVSSKKKWFPYNKGGEYRKWYGNNDYVVNWENDGLLIRNFKNAQGKLRSRPQNTQFYFKESVSWSLISSGNASFRYKPYGNIFDVAGMSCFSEDLLYYILGFANSPIVTEMLNILAPTLNFQAGDIANLPICVDKEKKGLIEEIVKQNIALAKEEWDAFEISWDFHRHPLLDYMVEAERETLVERVNQNGMYLDTMVETYLSIENAYSNWTMECDRRFYQLKANEEELNRIFIDIYGLEDELTPKIDDKDVTVRKANLQRDIKSFISYAVGCMFGRYSLYNVGLLYAGGSGGDYGSIIERIQDSLKTQGLSMFPKNEFYPDRDNIIPICDDEYFDDDITGLFVKFVETVYGKDTLDENLKFIADALGGKGTPKEVIRNYFLNDFFNDHCKTYQKRPIYWLFDSGKKNGFKALVYMHRYQPDTIARMRTDYVHEQQSRYRTAITDLENRIADASTSERVRLNKQLSKLRDQSEEIRKYEEKIHHLADQYIAIDLDDGVKVNYAKFQDVLAKIK